MRVFAVFCMNKIISGLFFKMFLPENDTTVYMFSENL